MHLMRDDVEIRPAIHSDIPAITSVARRTWSAAYAEIIPQNVQDDAIRAWYSPAKLTEAIDARNAVFLVAARAGMIVGFVNLVRMSPTTARLARIYLLPEAQRFGVGTRLFEASLRELAGVETVSVEVEERNHGGRSFYERRGFIMKCRALATIFDFEIPIVVYELNVNRGAA